MKTWVIRIGATGALAVLMAGCGGGGGDGGPTTTPSTSTNDPNAPMTATFSSIQSHVFTPICSACHAGASAPQGLKLDAANSFTMLVNVASNEVPSIKRVSPGDSANSYIIQKLEGHASVGARMPFGGPYLDAATIGLIRQWIDNGAAQ